MSSAPHRSRRKLAPSPSWALALLALVTLLIAAAPLLPLPDPAAMHPGLGAQGPTLRWEPVPELELSELARQHPRAAALRRACFGDRALTGLLGSDHLGRDLGARVLWGGRVSLLVGLLATLVSALIGVPWGVLAGSCGGWVDGLLMRVVDVLYAIPLIFVVILLVGLLRGMDASVAPDRLTVLFVVIGAVSWLTMARIVRGQVLSLKQREFVLASRALGCPPAWLVLRHVLPHLTGTVLVVLTLTVPKVMLFEAFLSFLGLGVEPPGVSWGVLASEGLENLTAVSTAWWLVAFPGAALALTLLALNLLGDGLRDSFDPRSRNR